MLSRTISISVGLILLIWLGVFAVSCNETERHRILTFFFDGVGPLRPAGFEEARIDPNFAQSPQEPLWYVHEPRKDCSLCHGKRGQKLYAPEAILIAPVPALCHDCHDDYTVSARFVHGPVAVGQCLFCHHHHKSRIQYLLNEPEPKLCYQCHDINMIESMPDHLTVQPSACTDCHNPHASSTKALLKEDRPRPRQNPDRVGSAMQDYVQHSKERRGNEQLSRQKREIADLYYRSMKLYRDGKLANARKGFVTVLKSGLIPPPMEETIRGYLSDIDNRLDKGATQQ